MRTREELLSTLGRLLRQLVDLPREAEGDGRRLSPQKWHVLHDLRIDGRRVLVAVEDVKSAPTARERQILQRLDAGETYKEIAYALGVSHSTVRVLVTRVRRRLGRGGRADDIPPKGPLPGDDPRASPC